MNPEIIDEPNFKAIRAIDEKLSRRFINLDPKGYFLIKLDLSSNQIIAEHYSNNIDEIGRAINPEDGKPLQCNETNKRIPINIYKGRTAKEIGVKISEVSSSLPISRLDHALYLGRELQRAESCLLSRSEYIQD
tara:strand:+ start:155 stop:556 length:402 start_codon:yes stop_codon:yes gene_type:complete